MMQKLIDMLAWLGLRRRSARLTKSRWSRFTTSVAVTLLLMASPNLAFGQADPDELARRHFESGAAYFEQAEYDSALREFRKAYELSQRPQILRNISVVEERLGNLDKAIEALDQYLAASPDDPDIDTVRIRRDNLVKRQRKRKAELAAQAPPPGPTTEEPAPEQPEPAESKPESVKTQPSPLAQPEQFPDEEAEPNLLPAYISLTIGGLAGAGALLTGVMAKVEYDDLKTSCGGSCSANQTSTGENLALTSTILTGVSLAGIGLGIVLWATADGGSESDAVAQHTPHIDVQVGSNSGFASARWSF